MFKIDLSDRIKQLPPYLFAEIERIVQQKKLAGNNIISLSIGDPDLPPPPFILNWLSEEATNPCNHNYSSSKGETWFRDAVSTWMEGRFKVHINGEAEVCALMGSKEGLSNIARAFVNPGDKVLVPNPSYPVYANGGVLLSGGVPISIPLLKENNFLPDLDSISSSNAKMLFLNYPNNPTGATLDKKFLKQIVDFALANNLILCYDNAYSEITFNGYKAPSIFEIKGAKDIGIEFHSLSKTFNMTGDRIAFAVGNEKLISGLVKVKSQIDSGPSKYIQRVAIRALQKYEGSVPPKWIKKIISVYRRRAEVLVTRLQNIGLECTVPQATFYVWAKCEGASMDFARKLIDVGVIVTPGVGFGEWGEGYIRFALTRPVEDIEEACRRIEQL